MTSSTSSNLPSLPIPGPGAVILAGAGLFLLFAATNVQSGWLYALDAVLWAVWLRDLLATTRRLPELSLSRLVPRHTQAGGPVTLVLSLQSPRALRGLEVADVGLSPGRTPPIPLGYLRQVAAGQTVSLSATLTAANRGRHAFTAVTCTTHGPFGLFRRRRTLPLASPIWVHPAIRPWQGPPPVTAAAGDGGNGSALSARTGSFAGVRPYRPGDPRRQIHWPLTARRGSPHVREVDRDLDGLPDRRITVAISLQGGPDTEAAVATAAALLADLWRRRIPIRLAGPGRAWCPGQWEEILEWLAELQPGEPTIEPPPAGPVVLVTDAPPRPQPLPHAAIFAPTAGSLLGVTFRPLLPGPEPGSG